MLRQLICNVQFFGIVLTIIFGIYLALFYDKLPIRIKQTANVNNEMKSEYIKEELFTNESLAWFNGDNNRPIFLALLGRVYDVTRGAKHYGPGCAYNYFVGRDASVSFVTGQFDNYVAEDADNVLTLGSGDILSLVNWETFYETDYIYKGKLIGRFYDVDGQPTDYYHKFRALAKQAEMDKRNRENIRQKYPDCNIEWSVEKGSHVWCTSNSGGNDRGWIGYPRKLFEIGNENFRCACVKEDDLETNEVMIKPYEDCEQFSRDCYYRVD